VFSLPTAAEVQKRLAFPLAGTSATPGVITMTLDARGVDRRWKSIVVVFNATPHATLQTADARATRLHPAHAERAATYADGRRKTASAPTVNPSMAIEMAMNAK